MSVQALAAAMNTGARTPSARLLMYVLANYADDQGCCYPGQATLCEKTGLGERAVRDNLKILEQDGLIRRSERRRNDGSRTSDLYHLMFAQPGWSPQPAKSAGSDQAAESDTTNRQMTPKSPADSAGHEPKGEPSEESSPPTPSRGGEALSKIVEQAIADYPAVGRAHTKPSMVAKAWPAISADAGGDQVLLACIRAHAAAVRLGDAVPGLQRWLTEGRWKVFSTKAPGGAERTWSGPPDVWDAVVEYARAHVALRGPALDYARAWLMPQGWRSVPSKAVVCTSKFAADRLKQDCGPAFRRLGVEVIYERQTVAA